MTTPTLVTVPQGGTMLDVLAERYRAAFAKMQGGREQWIEGTLEFAAVMLEAKERPELADNKAFSRWITYNQLEHLHPNERAGLIGIGKLHRKDPATARKLLEQNNGLSVRTIWEKRAKSSQATVTSSGNSQLRANIARRKRNRVPTVMRDDPVAVPFKRLSDLTLTPEQVDPDFKGTPLQFATQYGHVLLRTKDQIEETKRQEALITWAGTAADFARTGRVMLAALAAVDPATLAEWTSKPSKAEKLRAWCNSIQDACEAISKLRPSQ
jgi:hypothetical protein